MSLIKEQLGKRIELISINFNIVYISSLNPFFSAVTLLPNNKDKMRIPNVRYLTIDTIGMIKIKLLYLQNTNVRSAKIFFFKFNNI